MHPNVSIHAQHYAIVSDANLKHNDCNRAHSASMCQYLRNTFVRPVIHPSIPPVHAICTTQPTNQIDSAQRVHSTVQHSTAQHSTAQHSTEHHAQHSTSHHSAAQHCTAPNTMHNNRALLATVTRGENTRGLPHSRQKQTRRYLPRVDLIGCCAMDINKQAHAILHNLPPSQSTQSLMRLFDLSGPSAVCDWARHIQGCIAPQDCASLDLY